MRGSLVFVLFSALIAFAQPDAREIVQRSVQRDERSFTLARDYTYQVHNVFSELDGKGNAKQIHNETHEILFIGGKPYRRLIEKDSRPLGRNEEAREQAKLDRAIAEANKLTSAEKEKRFQDYTKRRMKDREALKDIPDAFDFRLLREETIAGRPAYVIQVEPRPSYRGKHRDVLSKIHGTLWIDQAGFHWIKVEAETLDTMSFGFFIARLAKGSRLEFEQTMINGEIWVPLRASARVSARVGLVKKFNLENEATFSSYRKFQTDSRIVSTSEVQQ